MRISKRLIQQSKIHKYQRELGLSNLPHIFKTLVTFFEDAFNELLKNTHLYSDLKIDDPYEKNKIKNCSFEHWK